MDSDNSVECPSPTVESTPHNTPLHQLPETSRKKYEVTYKKFMEWRQSKDIDHLSEQVILTYFQELAETLKSSTLWSFYSILRTTISAKHNIDISQYIKLRAFLKQRAFGYEAKKTKFLTRDQIYKFIETAPDDKYLLLKVALIIGTVGACRREELSKLQMENMQDLGSALLIKIPDIRTKCTRTCILTDKFYEIYLKYAKLRPPHITEGRFFLNYNNGKCTRNVIGINQFGRMPKQIAAFLHLEDPHLYTGHCFRRSSNAAGFDSGSTDKFGSQAFCNKFIDLPEKKNQTPTTSTNSSVQEKISTEVIDSINKKLRKDNLEKNDEYNTFGQYVANELRSLNDRFLLLETKQKINAILFEAQMKSLQNENQEQSSSPKPTSTTNVDLVLKAEPIDIADLKEESIDIDLEDSDFDDA